MQAKPVLLLHSVIGIILGSALLLIPDVMLSISGISPSAAAPFVAQQWACFVLGLALLAFMIRDEEHSSIRQSIFLSFIIIYAMVVVVEVVGFILALGSVNIVGTIGLHAIWPILYSILFIENR
jgi:heme/copper-type cytochrome/quinol oxidase subunit 4